MKFTCCEKLKHFYSVGIATFDTTAYPKKWIIWNKGEYAYQTQYPIDFCPFCGTKLQDTRIGEYPNYG